MRLTPPIAWSAGGGHVVRATLAARVLGRRGRPIVLLHGLGGSKSVWGAGYDVLGEGHRLVAMDLLGCGESPHPDHGYTLGAHADAVAAALAELDIHEPAVIVGHSFGSLVALALARSHPDLVSGVLAVCPPLFRSAVDARALTAAALTPVERFLYLPTWWSRLICRNVCMKRPGLAEACARRLRQELPPVLVTEAIMHTWNSYSESIAELLAAAARPEWIRELAVPVDILVGADDAMPDLSLLEEIERTTSHVHLTRVREANHLVPLTHVDDCLTAVGTLMARTESRGPRAGEVEAMSS